jgi:hypothetical protein
MEGKMSNPRKESISSDDSWEETFHNFCTSIRRKLKGWP